MLLLDAVGLGRGHFYVNGQDLGIYWPQEGISGTRRYYIPLELLRNDKANNTLVVFEELGARVQTLQLVYSQMEQPAPGTPCTFPLAAY